MQIQFYNKKKLNTEKHKIYFAILLLFFLKIEIFNKIIKQTIFYKYKKCTSQVIFILNPNLLDTFYFKNKK